MSEIQRSGQTQTQVAHVYPQYAEQQSGNVGASEAEISFEKPTSNILIKNTHATQSLTLYLKKSKTTWNSVGTVIAAGASLQIDFRASSIKLKGSGASTTYEILATYEN